MECCDVQLCHGGVMGHLVIDKDVLGLSFVDPNSWIEDGDFARDGLNLNGRGKRLLGQLHVELVDLMLADRQGT